MEYIKYIEEIISRVKANPDLLNTNDTQNIVLSQELLKKERNIKYLMSQSEPSFLPVQKLLYECVSDKFNELIMGTSAEVTDELKKYIVMYESKKKTLDSSDPRYMTPEQEQIVNLILSNNQMKSGKDVSNVLFPLPVVGSFPKILTSLISVSVLLIIAISKVTLSPASTCCFIV